MMIYEIEMYRQVTRLLFLYTQRLKVVTYFYYLTLDSLRLATCD
jgi:hypothetical protein